MPLPVIDAGDLLAGAMKGMAEGLNVLVGRSERVVDVGGIQTQKTSDEEYAEMLTLQASDKGAK